MEEAGDFQAAAVELAKFIIDYFENIRTRKVLPLLAPGFLRLMMSDRAPEEKEDWKEVFADIEQLIMPGVSSSIIETSSFI